MNNSWVSLALGVVVLWLIFAYLIPRLPEPLQTIAVVILIIITVAWIWGYLKPPSLRLP